jgi:hypothetical protein
MSRNFLQEGKFPGLSVRTEYHWSEQSRAESTWTGRSQPQRSLSEIGLSSTQQCNHEISNHQDSFHLVLLPWIPWLMARVSRPLSITWLVIIPFSSLTILKDYIPTCQEAVVELQSIQHARIQCYQPSNYFLVVLCGFSLLDDHCADQSDQFEFVANGARSTIYCTEHS